MPVRSSELGARSFSLTAAMAALVIVVFRADAEEPPPFKLETIRGHVVYLHDALGEMYGIRSVPEAKERMLALQSPERALIPLVEDVRGRAFRADERLRQVEVELLVRRYTGSPAVQVIRVFEIAKDGKYELDYWCDVCAIAMVELKPCECCQGPTELRRRKVE